MVLSQFLATVANKNLARPAFRYLGKETNYQELRAIIARLSYLFHKEVGLQARVAFVTRNSPAVITSFFAFSNTRSVVIPVDPDASPEDMLAWLRDSKATHVAVTSDTVTKVKEVLSNYKLRLPIIEIEKKQGGEYDKSFTTSSDHAPQERDTVLLLRTAGTSGPPKLAAFSHTQVIAAVQAVKGLIHPSMSDRTLTKLSWSHPFAFMMGMMFPILTGSTCVIDHGVEGADFLQFLSENRVTRILGNPPFFSRLLAACKAADRGVGIVKSFVVAGGKLSKELREEFEKIKVSIAYSYGQTENLWTIAMQDTAAPPTDDKKKQLVLESLPSNYTFLKPLAGFKYKVLDENGDTIESDEACVGHLALMAPTVMTGYQSASPDIEKLSKISIRGTWLYTGDIARLEKDEEENLSIAILGRKDELIKIHGDYVDLEEIRAFLPSLPGVIEGAGFVCKTATEEKILVIAVVKAPAAVITDKQVSDACAKYVLGGQAPRGVVFTDFIPKDFGDRPCYGRLALQFAGTFG